MKISAHRRLARNILAAFAATSLISSVKAENPPPCEPCKIVSLPEGNGQDLQADIGPTVKQGLHQFTIKVTWTPKNEPHRGIYLRSCWNVDGEDAARDTFPGTYAPTSNTKTYCLTPGGKQFVMSDTFKVQYVHPCSPGPKLDAYSYASRVIRIEAGKGGTQTNDPKDPNDPFNPFDPNDPPPIVPPKDPYQEVTETKDPCPEPFIPGRCSAFNNVDTRTSLDLPEPTQVEIVAENISLSHWKNGFVQYDYDPLVTLIPKYFLQEDATTSLSGGTPESPVGGDVTRRICRMTGELIETAKSGNPSFFGPRLGPNVTVTEITASGSFDVSSYDDCPNLENDEPGTMQFASVLSDEYTKERMRDDVISNAWDFKGAGYYRQESASATLLINNQEDYVNYEKTKYKIRVPADLPRPYKAVWMEEFTPKDTNLEDDLIPEKEYKSISEDISGSESIVHEMDPKSTPGKEGTWKVVMYHINADVDANRDGSIAFGDASDRTKAPKPFRYWINNDRDKAHPIDLDTIPDWEQDDVDESEKPVADCDEAGITCDRDLEDLTRMWVDLSGLPSDIDLNDSSISVKAHIEAISGSPTITLFRAVETDGGLHYLHDDDVYNPGATGWNQWHDGYESELCSVGSAIVDIPKIAYTSEGRIGSIRLLFEGKKIGDGKVIIECFKGSSKIATSQPIYIKLAEAKDMYETWTVGDVDKTGVDYDKKWWPAAVAQPVTGQDLPSPETDEEKDYFMFVHGWNMPPWEKETFASTAFKRLWHQGFKGRFGAYRWPTFWWTVGEGNGGINTGPLQGWVPLLDNFDASEQHAWNSAKPLYNLLNDRALIFNINGKSKVKLYGHSMGNVVSSEAMRQFGSNPGSKPPDVYVSAQAALSAHVWNNTTPRRDAIFGLPSTVFIVPDIYGYYWKSGELNTTPDLYKEHACESYMASIYMPSETNYVNHFNAKDFALSSWKFNQELKPDLGYSYRTDHITTSGEWRFLRTNQDGDVNLTFPNDCYEVFSYAAPSYSLATGAEPKTDAMFETSVDLDKDFQFGSPHKGHSAQFRSKIQQRWTYWKELIRNLNL